MAVREGRFGGLRHVCLRRGRLPSGAPELDAVVARCPGRVWPAQPLVQLDRKSDRRSTPS